MKTSALRNDDHLLHWMGATLLLISFGLGDAAIIAWCASAIDFGELFAVVFSFLLIEAGLFYTVWQMRRETKQISS